MCFDTSKDLGYLWASLAEQILLFFVTETEPQKEADRTRKDGVVMASHSSTTVSSTYFRQSNMASWEILEKIGWFTGF